MTRIRARMHGQAMRTGIQAGACRLGHIRLTTTTRIAQQGNLVEVDAERGHHAGLRACCPALLPRAAHGTVPARVTVSRARKRFATRYWRL